MCGISGIIKKNNNVSIDDLKLMSDLLSQRGPDAEGFFIENNVGFAHRRLSVIDLETGDQPMFSDDNSIAIIYNGEIYNFLEIKDELIKLNCSFKTKSDTEVIIKGYQKFGIDLLLNKLEGMFAFALYDKTNELIFIARDKFGEKPLYYSIQNDKIIFSSELKALEPFIDKKSISKEGLNFYLSLSYIPAPYTIYQTVEKLNPSSYLKIDNSFTINKIKYYNLIDKIIQKENKSFEVSKSELKNLLFDSVKKRMISDVPLGCFLSGGIDSSIIACVMNEISDRPINTFSIGFKEKEYDESNRAKIVADKIKSNHTIHYLSYNDIIELLDEILKYFDEPFADSSAIPSFYVAKLAREKVTVVLTGDCADEIFVGYEKYLANYYSNKYNLLPKFFKNLFEKFINLIPHSSLTNNLLRKIKKVIYNANHSFFDLHYNLMCMGFSDNERFSLLKGTNHFNIKERLLEKYNEFILGSEFEKGLYLDLTTVLEGDMLVKVDRMCMKNSLEARVPYLDSKIVELAYNMPLDFKLKGKNKKYILKETFKDLLPKETLKFSKKGFTAPIDHWLKNELKNELDELLNEDFINKQNIFNYNVIRKIYDDHFSGKENNMYKLWNLYVFQKWYKSIFTF
ncbi:MAG: asparagine synthase (glutamine-hydrolyzing) [Melioribacteraceae bacterium]|nr:asparagine synthase (glutamine-hydrolyzing) [Melioribacteraceae bacterium]